MKMRLAVRNRNDLVSSPIADGVPASSASLCCWRAKVAGKGTEDELDSISAPQHGGVNLPVVMDWLSA